MRVFLSHISEERSLAIVLKDWIESSFPDMVELFVSSDIRDIAAGDRWLHEIDGALEESHIFIVLCSLRSVTRPWINFETGCAWIKRVAVLPICHSGQSKSSLPRPLSEFQALETSDAGFIDDLMMSLAKHLELSKVPRIDANAMRLEISNAIASISEANSTDSQVASEASTASFSLDDEATEILQWLANLGDRGANLDEIVGNFKLPAAKMQYFLDELMNLNYIKRTIAYLTSPSRYKIRPEGRRFLVQEGLL